jgi:L-iditol 2-dehydrogenase
MKAIALTGPKQCELMEIPMPEKDGEHVIIKVTACGICGSDVHFWELGVGMDGKPGLVMGHEFAGIVHDPGSRADLTPGQKVTAVPINPCGTCSFCHTGLPNVCVEGAKRQLPGLNRLGAYSEYCTIRPDMVRILPDSVTDHAAALIEPSAVALHAVYQADIHSGHKVMVSGGGPVGLLAAMWAKHKGAAHVALSEINPYRLQFAGNREYIDTVYDAKDSGFGRSLRKTSGIMDRVIETSGSDAGIQSGLMVLKSRGKMVLTGISFKPQMIPTLMLTLKEIELKSAFGYTLPEFDESLDHICTGKLDVVHLVTRSVSMDQVQAAFEGLTSDGLEDIKIMIHP